MRFSTAGPPQPLHEPPRRRNGSKRARRRARKLRNIQRRAEARSARY